MNPYIEVGNDTQKLELGKWNGKDTKVTSSLLLMISMPTNLSWCMISSSQLQVDTNIRCYKNGICGKRNDLLRFLLKIAKIGLFFAVKTQIFRHYGDID